MTTRILIYSEADGVYLGSCMGLGFWSELDSVGQEEAVTFESIDDAKNYLETWKEKVSNIIFLPVETENRYASEKECLKAGVKPWIH